MINRNWLLGFIEGEGCFSIIIKKSGKDKKQYQVMADFSIKSTEDEISVLESIRQSLDNIGNIYMKSSEGNRTSELKNARNSIMFKVTKLSEIKKIIRTLDGLQFISQIKKTEFELWKDCVEMIDKREHLTREGLFQIAKMRDKLHGRKQWNKKNYCQVHNEIEPCEMFLKYKMVPKECKICD